MTCLILFFWAFFRGSIFLYFYFFISPQHPPHSLLTLWFVLSVANYVYIYSSIEVYRVLKMNINVMHYTTSIQLTVWMDLSLYDRNYSLISVLYMNLLLIKKLLYNLNLSLCMSISTICHLYLLFGQKGQYIFLFYNLINFCMANTRNK